MKFKSIFSTLILLSICGSLLAQPHGHKEDQIEAIKIGWITKQLELTPEEAKLFWPVYDQYSAEQEALRKDMRKSMKDTRENWEDMSDKDFNAVVDNMLSHRQKELDILTKYRNQFGEILTPKKVALLYKAEHEFKEKVKEIMRRRHEQMQNRGGGGMRGGGRGPMGGHGMRGF